MHMVVVMVGVAVHDSQVGLPSDDVMSLEPPLLTTSQAGIGEALSRNEKLVIRTQRLNPASAC
jgi:hypothetical protein